MTHRPKRRFKTLVGFSLRMIFHTIRATFLCSLVLPKERAIECSRKGLLHAHIIGADETRGRKQKLTDEQVHEADSILQDRYLQLEGKRLTREQLAIAGRTMHRELLLIMRIA